MSVNDSSTIITFERNTIPLINTAKPDADGYYEINAGAYGVFNESGIFYSAENIEKLFENSSVLQRRIEKGIVRAELGHPRFEPGMSEAAFDARHMEIREDRYCGHIRKAKLVNSNDGKTKITRISVIPFGHFKSTLEDALKTKDSNCFFSVRSCSNRRRVNGITVKYVYLIVTWDFVTEGGIRMANKFDTNLDLESMDYRTINSLNRTEELTSIDLNNTRDVKYILSNLEEYRIAHNVDLESNGVFGSIEDLLKKSITLDKEELIFNWR